MIFFEGAEVSFNGGIGEVEFVMITIFDDLDGVLEIFDSKLKPSLAIVVALAVF